MIIIYKSMNSNDNDTIECNTIFEHDQIIRIVDRYNPKYRQQKSNIKKKINYW